VNKADQIVSLHVPI